MLVYIITNKINGKQYVGQTSQNLERRWRSHKYPNNYKSHLHAAMRKYGVENFEIETLVIVKTKVEMDFYERELIKFLDFRNSEKGYNLTDGGEGASGALFSEEHKRKIGEAASRANTGRKHTLETRQKVSKSLLGNTRTLGHTQTEEHKVKIGKANSISMLGNKNGAGKIFSEKERKNISEGQFRNMTKEHRIRRTALANHKQWHVNRNIVNPNCVICKEVASAHA